MNLHLATLIATLALATPASAASVPTGLYIGTCSSSPTAPGEVAYLADVVQEGGKNHARLISKKPGENYYEDWVWDEATLTVTCHLFVPGSQRPDGRMREEVDQLRATFSAGSYHVLCPDPAGADCGMGMSAGSYLTIAPTRDGFRCEVWKTPGADRTGQVALQRAFVFKPAK